jgi:hypothetical protein
MNENVKKGLLGALIALALIVAVFEGINFVKEPKLEPAYTIGGGRPGHGMKAAEKAEAEKGGQGAGATDPLAGPSPTVTGPAGKAGSDR